MKQEQSPFYKRNKEFHSGSAYFYFFTAHTLIPHCICSPSKPDPARGGCHGTCRKTLNLPGPSIPPLKNKIRQTQSPLKCWSSVKIVGSPVWSRQKCDFLGNISHTQRTKLSFWTRRLQAPCISRSPLPSAGCTGLSIMVGGVPWPIPPSQSARVVLTCYLPFPFCGMNGDSCDSLCPRVQLGNRDLREQRWTGKTNGDTALALPFS